MSFSNIPAELKSLPQFVVWKYVARDDGKWTKLPYSPRTMNVASVTDPGTWSTFDHAVAVATSAQGVAGIGFVLTAQDDYCFTDLDDAYAVNPDGSPKFTNADAVMAKQQQIFQSMLSYAELSPSGKGLHIISKGRVEQGKRRGAVELYSSERYMTMTGNVYRDVPIQNCQPAIDWLYAELGGGPQAAVPQSMLYQSDKQPDDAVIKNALAAANGAKFQALWEGRWYDAGLVDNSWSAGDFALVDMLQFYTTSPQQIRRLFMASGLAKRDKASRPGYVEYMIQRSFDRLPANVDLEALTDALDRQLERQTVAREAGAQALAVPAQFLGPQQPAPAPAPLTTSAAEASPYLQPMPGLLGALAWFIYQAAPRPVPEIAVAGAIGLMAGICGRAFNVNATGLNVYILLLAKTGRGKEAIATGISRLMAPVKAIDGGGGGVPGADEFLGPQEIASGQALIKYLSKTSRSFVSVLSEFDRFLNQLTMRNVSPSTDKLKQVLLYAYSRSGQQQRLDKGIYSESDKNVAVIPAPAVSLIGEGTPDRFYELLSEELVSDGFLPRFSVIEYDGDRVPANKGFATIEPAKELVTAVAQLCSHCLTMNSRDQVTHVQFTPEAWALMEAFDVECDALCNRKTGAVTELWNRAQLKALKLAALIAVGVNWYAPIIDVSHARWAIECSRYDTTRLAAKFETGKIGIKSADTRQMIDIRRKLQALFNRKVKAATYKLSDAAIQAGVFNSLYMQGATSNLGSFKEDRRGASAAYHAMMISLVRMGVIDELSRDDKTKLAITGSGYVVKDWDWVNREID